MTRNDDLDELDDILAGMRRLLQRPGYRRRFLAALGEPVRPGTLQAVRAVERLEPPDPFVGDLAATLGVDASSATRLVDQAVEDGYLDRTPSPTDLRRKALRLTDRGIELLEHATEVRRALLSEVTADWTAEDLRSLTTLLGRLTRGLDRFEQ